MKLAYLQVGDVIEEDAWCEDCGQASCVLFVVHRLSSSGVGIYGEVSGCTLCEKRVLYKTSLD